MFVLRYLRKETLLLSDNDIDLAAGGVATLPATGESNSCIGDDADAARITETNTKDVQHGETKQSSGNWHPFNETMMDFGGGETKNPFVCPNDRQLALRAKLRTGWSVKTASLGYHQTTNQSIDHEEQATILEVIQRAEQLERSEQERVGRLMERLENMRRNALGKNPTQCLLCGHHFGMLGAQKLRCVDCKQFVCHKCSIENFTNNCSKESHLCLICAETREIWKKSGAWFFKSLPKYVLPGQLAFSSQKRGSKRSRFGMNQKDEESSSDEDRRLWKLPERRNSSTESTQEVIDSTEQHAYSRQTSSTESHISRELEPLRQYMSNVNLDVKYWDENSVEIYRADSFSGDGSEVSRNSRRDSLASRSLSDYWGSDIRSDDRVSPSTSSLNSSIFKNPIEENKSLDTSMGIMELSLTYDPVTSTLHSTVYRAKNLIPMDINGLADPFCKLNILPSGNVSTRLRTKTVHKTRNPEFNENLTFYEITENDLATKSLHVLMVDDDKYGHDYMGEIRVPLAKLKIQNTIYLTLPLEKLHPDRKGPNPGPDLNEWFDDLWLRGQILISLCYSTKKRSLLVTIVRCANLLPMDNNGFSDPFVKLYLRPDPYHRKHKTSVKWKNLNPIFNEEFAFETRPTELSTQSLHLAVWDKDYGKSNDYLGGLVIGGVGSKGQRLKHWLDMIRYPDHRHDYWHNLTEDQIND